MTNLLRLMLAFFLTGITSGVHATFIQTSRTVSNLLVDVNGISSYSQCSSDVAVALRSYGGAEGTSDATALGGVSCSNQTSGLHIDAGGAMAVASIDSEIPGGYSALIDRRIDLGQVSFAGGKLSMTLTGNFDLMTSGDGNYPALPHNYYSTSGAANFFLFSLLLTDVDGRIAQGINGLDEPPQINFCNPTLTIRPVYGCVQPGTYTTSGAYSFNYEESRPAIAGLYNATLLLRTAVFTQFAVGEIPEPSTLVLVAAPLMGVAITRRRKLAARTA